MVGGVGVEEGGRLVVGGGGECLVLASGGSQRETEAAGFGRRLAAGGSDGAETDRAARGRSKPASQQATAKRCAKEKSSERAKSR